MISTDQMPVFFLFKYTCTFDICLIIGQKFKAKTNVKERKKNAVLTNNRQFTNCHQFTQLTLSSFNKKVTWVSEVKIQAHIESSGCFSVT